MRMVTARELANLMVMWFIVIALNVAEREACAQCEHQQMHAVVPQPEDWFGGLIAMDGDYAAVGLFTADTNGVDSGAVLMYRRETTTGAWSFAQQIVPADNRPGDRFGISVSISDDVLTVGARRDDDVAPDGGSVYVFRLNRQSSLWMQETELYASDATADSGFGYVTSVANDLLVVGATHASDSGGVDQAYVFRRDELSGWNQEAILTPVTGSTNIFGWSVATDGATVMVGGKSSGTMYWVDVFEQSQAGVWQRTQQLVEASWVFGHAIDLDAGLAIIAGLWSDASSPGQWRSGYVFRRDPDTGSWTIEARLDAARSSLDATWIGPPSVGITGTTAVIGAYDAYQFFPFYNHGVAAIFTRGPTARWNRVATLAPSAVMPDAYPYGMAVALDDANLLVGAPDFSESHPSGNYLSSIYAIDLAGVDCNDNVACDDLDIANGTSPDLNANGIPDECEGIPGDANGDRQVDVDDLLAVITAWGPCPIPPVPCPADIAPPGDGDGVVNVDDLLQVVLHWTG